MTFPGGGEKKRKSCEAEVAHSTETEGSNADELLNGGEKNIFIKGRKGRGKI